MFWIALTFNSILTEHSSSLKCMEKLCIQNASFSHTILSLLREKVNSQNSISNSCRQFNILRIQLRIWLSFLNAGLLEEEQFLQLAPTFGWNWKPIEGGNYRKDIQVLFNYPSWIRKCPFKLYWKPFAQCKNWASCLFCSGNRKGNRIRPTLRFSTQFFWLGILQKDALSKLFPFTCSWIHQGKGIRSKISFQFASIYPEKCGKNALYFWWITLKKTTFCPNCSFLSTFDFPEYNSQLLPWLEQVFPNSSCPGTSTSFGLFWRNSIDICAIRLWENSSR